MVRDMRLRIVAAFLLSFVAAGVPAAGQGQSKSPFTVDFDPITGVTTEPRPDGQAGLYFTVRFSIIRQGGADEPGKDYKVVIENDGREVARVDVPPPKLSEELSAMLTIDISGSMAKDVQGNKTNTKRIDQARVAARSFIDRLPKKADCGLILFDHEVLKEDTVPPIKDRKPLLTIIGRMAPRGGTAYLDATLESVHLLANLNNGRREKAVVVMTDGVDLNSNASLKTVIDAAKKAKVKVHTIGIGEPGTGKPVNSVLVLDHSQSMQEPAEDSDPRSKIAAMHKAAGRFVKIMPETARTTILPFGSIIDLPDNFSKDKKKLVNRIEGLTPSGETAMLDAAYEAIETLDAANLDGTRAVVVMTDGIDNISRRRPEDIIRRAKDAKVTMHMLAFGRESEMRQARDDMQRIATETGGTFHHARNEKDLIQIFEEMSIALHDDGIDVKSLTKLAQDTGGKYHPARDVNRLKLILEQLSMELQKKEYVVSFDDPRGFDAVTRRISIKLIRTGTNPQSAASAPEVVQEQSADAAVRGVVVAEMNPFVYLVLLGVLVVMLIVPSTLGRMARSARSA
jgi:VWFA-related protein